MPIWCTNRAHKMLGSRTLDVQGGFQRHGGVSQPSLCHVSLKVFCKMFLNITPKSCMSWERMGREKRSK